MFKKIILIIYYILISKLPHSRYLSLSNKIRLCYVSKLLNIIEPDSESYFENDIYISNADNIKIGNHCHINEKCFIQGATIGDYVMIGPNVSILNSTHNFNNIDIPMIMQGEKKNLNPVIENDVWIGRNAIILPGVKIKTGCIVGAGAVVAKDTEAFSIVGGVPAKLIKKRNIEEQNVRNNR